MKLPLCPTCGKRFDPVTTKAMPFCCERCRQIDLGRWLEEKIALPVESGDDEELPEHEEE